MPEIPVPTMAILSRADEPGSLGFIIAAALELPEGGGLGVIYTDWRFVRMPD